MPQITIKIPSIHCASCVGRITETLKKNPAVRDARVSFATRSAVVEIEGHDPYSPISTILEDLEKIGYPGEIAAEIRPEELRKDLLGEGKRWLLSAAASGLVALAFMLLHPSLSIQGSLATAAMLVSGSKFLRSAWKALASRILTMDVLIAWGTSVAYVSGIVAAVAGAPSHFYFESAVMILALISLGRYLETRTRAGAGNSLQKLQQGMPLSVRRIVGDKEELVSATVLKAGDAIRVQTGEKVAVDGCAQDAGALVNDSFWTGQSEWQEVKTGQKIAAGSMVEQGALTLRVEKNARESALAQLEGMVAQAQQSKASVELLVDKVSGIFIPVVLLLSMVTFAGWMVFSGSWAKAVQAAVAVIIIACPCALGLATPTALMVGMGVGAVAGILMRNARALEQWNKITAVFLDKTGTITDGKLALVRLVPRDVTEEALLRWALTAEQKASHPLARAVCKEAARKGIAPLGEGSVRVERGYGVEMECKGHLVRVGRREWIKAGAGEWVKEEQEGFSVAGVDVDGKFLGCLLFRDSIRSEAPAVVADLKKMGCRVAIVSGDQEHSVRKVAERLGVDAYYFGQDPGQKANVIRQHQAKKGKVAFVGDGINDAAALASADLGIAMGTGTDIAKEAGDILLVRPDLRGLTQALRLSKAIFRVLRQNLFWALAYNAAMIPLAAFGKINPTLAAGAMALSSVTVVLNSLSLRWIFTPALSQVDRWKMAI